MAQEEAITLEDVVAKVNELTTVVTRQQTELEEITTQYKGLVSFVNDNFKQSNNTLKVLDNLTFMAVADMYERGVEFSLNPESINATSGQIKSIVTMFNEYREKLEKAAEEEEERQRKAAEKKALVAEKRAIRKGKVAKDAEAN